MRRLASITLLRHLSLIGNRLSVEHVTSLIAAAAGLRELHAVRTHLRRRPPGCRRPRLRHSCLRRPPSHMLF